VVVLFCFFVLASLVLVSPLVTSYDLIDFLKEGLYGQAIGTGSVGLSLLPSELIVFIQSPENITYNFTRQQNRDNERFIDLNVSANEPDSEITQWYYELVDVRHSLTVTDIFSPNISINAFRWENIMTVFAEDRAGRVGNETVSFFVFVPNSAPVLGPIDSEIFVCEGGFLNYPFNASDIDEDVMTFVLAPSTLFSVETDPGVPGFYVNHIQSGILVKTEVGFYGENVSVKDNFDGSCCVDSAFTNITVIEINNDPVVTNPGVQTVWTRGENGTLYLEMMIDDVEDGDENSGNLTINVSFSNQTLFNITQNGIVNYSGNIVDLGVHDVTVCATDLGIPVARRHVNISLCEPDNLGANDTGCTLFELTVTDQNRQPRIIEFGPTNLSFNATPSVTYFFNITKHDPDGTTPDGYWYVDGDL